MYPKCVCLGKSLMVNFLSSSKKKSTYRVETWTKTSIWKSPLRRVVPKTFALMLSFIAVTSLTYYLPFDSNYPPSFNVILPYFGQSDMKGHKSIRLSCADDFETRRPPSGTQTPFRGRNKEERVISSRYWGWSDEVTKASTATQSSNGTVWAKNGKIVQK